MNTKTINQELKLSAVEILQLFQNVATREDLENLRHEIRADIAEINSKFDRFQQLTDNKFTLVDNKFTLVFTKLNELDLKIYTLSNKVNLIDKKFNWVLGLLAGGWAILGAGIYFVLSKINTILESLHKLAP
jgi:hypothetical protein